MAIIGGVFVHKGHGVVVCVQLNARLLARDDVADMHLSVGMNDTSICSGAADQTSQIRGRAGNNPIASRRKWKARSGPAQHGGVCREPRAMTSHWAMIRPAIEMIPASSP